MSNGSFFRLDGKRALVTGGAIGLGFEMARALASAGASVILHGRDVDRLGSATTKLKAEFPGCNFTIALGDLADSNATQAMMQSAGAVDILVNNAGVRDRRPLADLDRAAVRELLEVDLVAPFELARLAAERMAVGGRIINICSIAGPIARAGDAAYTAAKGGLAALTRALAAELGPRGITVNGIAPGYFATDANATMVADPGVADWLARRTSIGRWGRPDEIGAALLFLASAEASYVTGQVIAVDGGYLAHF